MTKLISSLNAYIPSKKISPTDRAGVNGAEVYGGFINSNEKNPILSGNQKYTTYSDILVNVSIVGAGVRYFLNLITKSSWKIESASDKPEARKHAELLESMLYDMETPWHRIVRKGVMYKFYGFGVQEWIAKKRPDGVIGLLDLEARPQKTITQWDLYDSGKVKGLIQTKPMSSEMVYIPREKVVYIVDDTLSDNPDGLGLLRHVVSPAKRLLRYEELEGYGFETDLRGIPVGRAPFAELQRLVEEGSLTAEQKTQIERPLKDFIENHIKGPKLGLLLDSMTYQSSNEAQTPSNVPLWGVDLLKSGSEGLPEISNSINRVSMEIARILGVEGLMLGQGKGSQALSRDKSDNFYMVVDSAQTELADCYSKDIVNTIWNLNGWPDETKPWFKTDSIQLRDIENITGALKDMAQAGAVLAPDDPAILEVRDLLGLSRPTADNIELTLLNNRGDRTGDPEKDE